MSLYPNTPDQAHGPPLTFRPSTLRAVRSFSRSKLWRGTFEERQTKFRQLHADLCKIYGVDPALVILGDGTGASGGSFFIPAMNVIELRGRLSVITLQVHSLFRINEPLLTLFRLRPVVYCGTNVRDTSNSLVKATMKNVLPTSKTPAVPGLIASVLLFCNGSTILRAADDALKQDLKPTKNVYQVTGNPYLPLWEHVPDSEPRVFEDPDNPGKYRIYITGSHDTAVTGYCGNDNRQWSAPVEDLSSWRDEGPVFTFQAGNRWDAMYAPDLVEVKGKDGKKEYYLYPNSRGGGREAVAAKSDRPDGPFKPINLQPNGSRTVQGSVIGYDPAVFVDTITDPKDPDFEIGYRAYGYWGFQGSSAGELDPKTMYTLRPGTQAITRFLPSRILPGQDPGGFSFFEASSMRKVGNKYVFIYSGNSGPEYGLGRSTATLRYAYGDSPLGPWKNGGVLVDARGVVPTQDGTKLQATYSGHNTHGSIQVMNDQWYVFYHRAPRGFGYARQAMVAPLKIENDAKSVADGGELTIRAYDPYAKDNLWTAKGSQGAEYTGAEVTSEGFHIFGLDPYQYYSAGYACFLSNPRLPQDTYDIWDNNMPLANVQSGNIIGYKYFGFGGLDKDTKGVKAFEGVKPGNHTAFNVFLTPKTAEAFKINVWLDGPWDNATWKGKKIGEINVPANAPHDVSKFTLDVASAVENLKEKHAIFLVAEGPAGSLCDIVGLGFSSDKKQIVRPVPPSVTIKVNGEAIQLPANPVRSTGANGITGYDIYEASYAVPATATEIPQVSATASEPGVKVDVTQAQSTGETAVVKFGNQGVFKTYRVVFASK